MVVNPKPHVVKKLKKMAADEGISLNAMVTPYLNAIAAGRLVMSPEFLPPSRIAQDK